MQAVEKMVRYKRWAGEKFIAAVAQLPQGALVAPRPILFGSIIRTLHHSYAMDRVWRAHLLGEPHGYTTRNPETHPPFEELCARQLEIDAWYIGHCEQLGAADLHRPVHFEFIGGGKGLMTCEEIILHVVNHATYHRGHVADMLYDYGIFPPATDLPVFVREQGYR
jgi:uncharacterized damage-inducible protein DinB